MTALLGAENVVKVHESIMMQSVHSLAKAETVPSFQRVVSAEIKNLPRRTRFFSTFS